MIATDIATFLKLQCSCLFGPAGDSDQNFLYQLGIDGTYIGRGHMLRSTRLMPGAIHPVWEYTKS